MVSAQVDTSIVPAGRATVWNPGVPGGVPVRTTVCSTVNASTYGNGSSDATGGIQSAINGCPLGQVVQLSAGTFRISTAPLRLNRGITLRGMGPTQTILKEPDGGGQAVITIGQQWPGMAGSTNFTSDGVKGTNSVAVASTSGLSVGQIVLIDMVTNPAITYWAADCTGACRGWFSRTDRPVSEMKEIATISGTTVTFTTPFHITYDVAHTAQVTRYSVAAVKNAGLEDLKLYGGEGGDGGGNAYVELAAYSWIKNIESEWTVGASVHMYQTFRVTVRDSYFYHTKDPNPGGAGYGIDISRSSSDNLIENNISWNFNKVILMRAGGGGNVVAYNYFEDGYGSGYKSIMETGLNASHMTTSHYVLFEGNQAFNVGADARWGNSVYITFLRNHSTTVRRSIGGLGLTDQGDRAAINIKARHYWYTFIGNVLGFSGMPGGPFTYEGSSDSPVPMWKLGGGDATGTPGLNNDPQVKATMVRDGNFDYATNLVHWDRTAQTIPNSLYLTNKPAFFGNCQWPWVDPTGATKLYTLPARARFDGNANACGPTSTPPAAPANVRIVK